jgi:radical SAM superfamily enzyme YgiQ (UPF0313 family)
MLFSPLQYDEPLFRPPSEAYSLIFQITVGCAWNRCAFCEMYTGKTFRTKPLEKIKSEIQRAVRLDLGAKKVFLADGDALVLSADKLLPILSEINSQLKGIRRISAYAKPKDLASKSLDELKALKSAGLDLVYVGVESGDDEVLMRVNKGETFESTKEGLLKAKQAGIKLSLMILNGLGGKELSRQHAENSAKLMNAVQPEFLSTLVLSFPYGEAHFKERFKGDFSVLNIKELIEEMRIFLENTDLKQTVFRSDHASNYLVLKGILGRDKEKLLQAIDRVLENPEQAGLRKDEERGL